MFTADAIIDAVQTGKKTFINTFVTNEPTKAALVKFVDAQADYTRKAAKASLDTFTVISSESLKQAQEATKFDFNKAYNTMTEAFKVAKK